MIRRWLQRRRWRRLGRKLRKHGYTIASGYRSPSDEQVDSIHERSYHYGPR